MRALAALALVLLAGCGVPVVVQDGRLSPSPTPVMGPPSLSAEQLTNWFNRHSPGGYRATVPPLELARVFIQEGVREGVRGDIAFMQSILETGWFRWPGGQVVPSDNNFAGIGATDSGGGRSVVEFASARLGARAQMQHLRAYATTEGRCGDPCLDPRFNLVRRGSGVYWDQYGNGVWASSKNNYGGRILLLFASALG